MNTAPVYFGANDDQFGKFLFQLAAGWLPLNWSIFTTT